MMFVRMMHNPFGYVAIGVIVPFAEEIVFRGAILRNLLRLFDGKPWAAILISAIIFGLVHGNSAQFLKCFFARNLIGLDVLSHGEYHPWLCTSLGQQHRCICCCQSHARL